MESLLEQPEIIAALVVLGLFIGSLTGMFGIGGAFIATPVMITLIGIDPSLALGCSMGFTLFNGILSGFHHFRVGNYSKWASPPVAIGAGVGILAGFLLHQYFRESLTGPGFERLINSLFFIILIPIAILVWRRHKLPEQPEDEGPRLVHKIKIPPMKHVGDGLSVSLTLLFLIGVVIGTLKGLIGIGGGVILVPILVMFIGLTPHKAVGTSLTLVVTSSLFGLILYAREGQFDFWIVGAFLVGSTIGVQIGTRLSKAVDGKLLLKLFSGLIFAFSAFLLIDIVSSWLQSRGV